MRLRGKGEGKGMEIEGVCVKVFNEKCGKVCARREDMCVGGRVGRSIC